MQALTCCLLLILGLLTGRTRSTSKYRLASPAQMLSCFPTGQLGIRVQPELLAAGHMFTTKLLLSSATIWPTVNLQNSSASHGWCSSGLTHPSRRWCQHSSLTGFWLKALPFVATGQGNNQRSEAGPRRAAILAALTQTPSEYVGLYWDGGFGAAPHSIILIQLRSAGPAAYFNPTTEPQFCPTTTETI